MNKTWLSASLGLVWLLSGLAGAQERPDAFALQVPLTVQGEGPWYRLDLPLALHVQARHADLRDVRVFNAEDEALAYALIQDDPQSSETRQDVLVKWFPLDGSIQEQGAPAVRVQRNTTGTLVEVAPQEPIAGQAVRRGWLLDASQVGAPLHRLQLDWEGEGEGFQRFSIEASDDLQHWRSWGEGQIARLSFAGEHIDQRDIELPGMPARYLRLLWLAPQKAPTLTAATLTGIRREVSAPPLSWLSLAGEKGDKADTFIWRLPLALPVERVRVALPEGNRLAPVTLSSRLEDKAPWQSLTHGLLYRLPQGGKDVLQDEIELFGWPVRQLRLQVDPRGGGLGEQPPALQVAMRGTQLVFLARGSAPYRLAIGNEGASSGAMSVQMLIPGYEPARLESLGRASLPERLPEASQPKTEAPEAEGFDWKRVVLWGVLLAGVALLGGMAGSLLRQKR
ncbi:DUF3999 domain-containing protein [Pseudomonas sp. LRF_L74]|uniref:DUF3999 domain-containing protein n=1 Tax=Pseudomonas sp. LRF_L74 TaxID=3369422 RepID=UPI003F63430A